MTTPLVLGPVIFGGELHLPDDAMWIAEIEAPEDSPGFAPGSVITWSYPEVPDPDDETLPTVWTATLTEERDDHNFAVARWEINKAEARRVALAEPEKGRLHTAADADSEPLLWDVWRVRRV